MKAMKIIITSILSAILLIFAGCEKDFLETQPSDQLAGEQLFQTYDGALTVLDGTYRLMYSWKDNHNEFNEKALHINADLKGEDMEIWSEGYGWFTDQYAYEDIDATQRFTEFIWDYTYDLVNNANRILAKIDDVEATEKEYNYIKGQALALRAHAFFNLVRHYQHTYKGNEDAPGIPVYTEPTTQGKSRATVQEVYTQIEDDLSKAISILDPSNCLTRGEAGRNKSHINQDVAEGIMARVKLNMEKWGEAASYAADAVENYELYTPEEYTSDAFNSVDAKEWMWGSQVNKEQQTTYASFFSHMDPTFMSYAALGLMKQITDTLYKQIPADDVRKNMWMDATTPADVPYGMIPERSQMKFLSSNPSSFLGDYLYMRASEMYLIQAEAFAEAENYSDAQTVLNTLVSKRQPGYSTSLTGQDLLEEIYFQRRIELWGEGFRWFDIKRRKEPVERIGHDLSLAKYETIPAESDLMIYQIPEEEMDANDQLTNQNP